MSIRISIAAIVLAVAALVAGGVGRTMAAPQAGGGSAAITGSVVDQSLQTLQGVDVTLARAGTVVARTRTDKDGMYAFRQLAAGSYRVSASLSGFQPVEREITVRDGGLAQLPLVLLPPGFAEEAANEVVEPDAAPSRMVSVVQGIPKPQPTAPPSGRMGGAPSDTVSVAHAEGTQYLMDSGYAPNVSGETYSRFRSNTFQRTLDVPLSTFSADVDTASYANVRRFLHAGQLPPTDAVRVEELVNYFRMEFDGRGDGPITVMTEVGDAPWAPAHKLVLIGVQARATRAREIEGRNIVLLIDVSGSMAPGNRLPMLKTALSLFVDTLRPDDRIGIVTYAGSSGVALRPTPARERDRILTAIANLNAGGSTNGAQGLVTAYRLARESFVAGGVNRVILATDGDFNVGVVGDRALRDLIERERRSGVFLSVLGVGEGNLKDRTMEMLADHGNGHYAYIDTLPEARRVLINEGNATLETVATDVKFQVEFNPAEVAAWKLIGYENRALADEDFNDDQKDAGDLGAGHSVTVLYEIVPVGVRGSGDVRPAVDPLKYQAAPAAQMRLAQDAPAGELATVKVRFKEPGSDTSRLTEHVVRGGGQVVNLPFAAAVAEYGTLLRKRGSSEEWDALVARLRTIDAPASVGDDYRGFVELVELARGIVRSH